jgi:hypothetical protein
VWLFVAEDVGHRECRDTVTAVARPDERKQYLVVIDLIHTPVTAEHAVHLKGVCHEQDFPDIRLDRTWLRTRA